MKNIQLLIKPTSSMCNLNCTYCFYKDVAEHREIENYGFMNIDTLEILIKKALESAEGNCTIAFQGGEPMLIGLEFYKKVIEFQEKYNINGVCIHNAIQTNGYYLDKQWARFFKENHFLVGISLDGHPKVHNKYRVHKNGKGSFEEVMQGINILQKYEVEFNVLTVITNETANKIESIYKFFMKNELKYQQYIPCLAPIDECKEKTNYTLDVKAYEIFLKKLFELWYKDGMSGTQISIRQFENYVWMLLGYPPESCGMCGVCGYQNIVEADGSIYPCDFYVMDDYKLGNIKTDAFEEIYKKREEIGFIERSRQVHPDCVGCKHYDLCRGGCQRYRDDFSAYQLEKNLYCEAYYNFFEEAKERLEQLVDNLKNQ